MAFLFFLFVIVQNVNIKSVFYLLRLLELTFVALDVVGFIKLLTRFDVFDAMPLRFVSLELGRAAFVAGLDCESECEIDTVFRNAGRCGEFDMGGVIEFELEVFVYKPPMLEPLELLRLAGVLRYEFRLLLPFNVLFDAVLCCCTSFFLNDVLSATELELCRVDDGDCVVDGLSPMFRTVLIEAELFNDDLELRKEVREPLLSTSCLLVDIDPVSILRRKEFVLFGIMLVLACGVTTDGVARNERLRSKL